MSHVSYRPLARTAFEWSRTPWALGQAEQDCAGDVCYPIVSRVDKAGASALLALLKNASSACVESAGGDEDANALAQKLERASLGIEASVGLTALDKKFLDAVQACAPAGTPTGTSPTEPTGSPWTLPLIVGGSAIGVAVLASAIWGGK